MVGFGQYLSTVGKEHGLEHQLIDYYDLKLMLEDIRRGRAASEEVNDTDLLEQIHTAGDGSGSQDNNSGAQVTPTLPTPSVEARCTPEQFIQKLEDELDRVNNIVKVKIRSLRRVRKVLDSARAVRGSSRNAQEFGIVMVQLSNLYDDIMLVLWFMYLNSIGTSKIVKKYNKNVPAQHKYTVDPARWLFLRAGLVSVQKAKAVTENEYAACVDAAPGELSKSDKVDRELKDKNRLVIELAEGMRELIRENRHHLFLQGDPTDWAVVPTLQPTKSERKEPRRRPDSFRIDSGTLSAQYIVGPVIGSGAYGVVHKARRRNNAQCVAVKTIYDPWSHAILGQRTYREIQIMQQLRHPNIVPLLDLLIDPNRKDLHIIMPIIAYTCEELLVKGQLLSQHKKWFMLQLLSAIAYCHALGVVHRDLKLSNILIDDTPKLFLSDFGLARTLSAGDQTASNDNPDYVQTQWYRAPEVLLCRRRTTTASDMWSLGCIFAELLTGVPLFPGQDAQQQLELILACCPVPAASKLRTEITQEIPGRTLVPDRTLEDALMMSWRSGAGQEDFEFSSALGLMSQLLQFEPDERASAASLLEHEWFQDIPVHDSLIDAVKASAKPMCGEEPVRLDLPCTQLHSTGAYRDALVTSTRAITYKKRMKDMRIARHQAAQTIQRWWLWRKGRGERPVLTARKRQLMNAHAPSGAMSLSRSVCGSMSTVSTPPDHMPPRRRVKDPLLDVPTLNCQCSLLPSCKTLSSVCPIQ